MKVLLVDPNPTTQKVVELSLEGEDVELIGVSGGREAIEMGEADPPDVILFSETLDDMGISDFCRLLDDHSQMKDIPRVVLISGEGVTPRELLEFGLPLYLEKPFETKELTAKIKEAILSESGVADGEDLFTEDSETSAGDDDLVEEALGLEIDFEEGEEAAAEEGMDETAEAPLDEDETEPETEKVESDFTSSLEALSNELIEESSKSGTGEMGADELEDEISIAEELRTQEDPFELDDSLFQSVEEDESHYVRPDPPAVESVSPPSHEDSTATPPVFEGMGESLNRHFIEAVQRTLSESLEETLKECIEKAVEDIKPSLLETAELQLKRFLPRMTEIVIRQEIEKLKETISQDPQESPDETT